MKKFILNYLLVCIILIVQTLSQQWYTENNPTFLSSATLSKVLLNDYQIKIIAFITLQCKICESLKDNMEDLIVELNVDGRNDIKLYFIDCNYQSKICQQMRISDIPFVIVFNQFGQASAQIVVKHFGVQQVVRFVENSIKQIDYYNQIDRKKTQNLRYTPSLSKQSQKSIKIHQKQNQQEQLKYQKSNQPIVQIQPQLAEQKEKDYQTDSQRQKIVENVLNERKKKASFWNIQISSKLGPIAFLIFGIVAFIYAKKLLASSTKSHKIVLKYKNPYNQVPNYQEGDFTRYSFKKIDDQKANQ